MRFRGIATGIAVLISLSACSGGSDPAPPDNPKDVVRTIDPAKAESLKLGDDLEVVAELPNKVGKTDAYFSGFTPDGMVLGAISLPDPPTGGQMGGVSTQGHPVLYDPETKKTTVLDDRDRKKPTQIGEVKADDNVVVWVETPDTSIGVSTFTVYSYDRESKKVAQLASYTDPKGDFAYGSDLTLDGDTVYFSNVAWLPKNIEKSAVYAVPIDGSAAAKVLVKGVGAIARIEDGVMTYATGKDRWATRNLSTGETSPVPMSPEANDPGFCGAEITSSYETLCMGTPSGDETETVTGAKLTIKETSGRTTVFKPFPSDSPNHPTPHGVRAVGPWTGVTMTSDGGADRQYLVDLESLAMMAFPRTPGSSR